MKHFLIFISALILFNPISVMSKELTGRQIMELQQKRHMVKNDTASIVLRLIDRKGNEKKRIFKRYGKEFRNGLKRGLIVFVEPKDIAGTALLTWEIEGGKSKQWLYLPRQKRMQRITSHGKKGYFMGTDFTFKDLQPDAIENYKYTILRSEEMDGSDCYVIEAIPATKEKQRDSGYSKRLFWLRKNIYFPVKIEFYDRRGRLLKTQTNQGITNLRGSAWMTKRSLMENHKEKHTTIMRVEKQGIDIPLKDRIFTERFILSGKHLK